MDHKLDENGNNANIGIRGFTTWKKSSDKILPAVGIEPWPLITSDSKSNTILSALTWHVLLRRSLNLCLCTTWYFNFDDLRGINRARLYKEPKVSVLEQMSSQWHSKASDANIGIIANFVYLWKTRMPNVFCLMWNMLRSFIWQEENSGYNLSKCNQNS